MLQQVLILISAWVWGEERRWLGTEPRNSSGHEFSGPSSGLRKCMLKDSILSHIEREKTMYLGLQGMEVFKGERGHGVYTRTECFQNAEACGFLKHCGK